MHEKAWSHEPESLLADAQGRRRIRAQLLCGGFKPKRLAQWDGARSVTRAGVLFRNNETLTPTQMLESAIANL